MFFSIVLEYSRPAVSTVALWARNKKPLEMASPLVFAFMQTERAKVDDVWVQVRLLLPKKSKKIMRFIYACWSLNTALEAH